MGEETTVINSGTGVVEIIGLANGLVVNAHASYVSDGNGHSIQSSTHQFVRTTTGDATCETLYGDSFLDVMLGNGGNDSLVGMAGDDELSGHAGADFLFGAGFAAGGAFTLGSGNDTLDGGAENDGLWGGDGNDKLSGGAGNDGMCGGGGDDELNGGDGGDFLFGGDFSVVDGSRLPGSGKDTLNGVLYEDRDGLDIASRSVAWRETKMAALALLKERTARGEEIREGQFEITDASGNFLFRVRLYEPSFPRKGPPEPPVRRSLEKRVPRL